MYLYSAFIVVPHTQGAQVRITQFYRQITPYLPLPRKRSPDGASPDWGSGHLIAVYYSFIYPKRLFTGFNTDSFVLENCIFGVSLKAYHDPETELTCNLAHNVQTDVSLFSVIFNDFCSVLWDYECYCTLLRGGRFFSGHSVLIQNLYVKLM